MKTHLLLMAAGASCLAIAGCSDRGRYQDSGYGYQNERSTYEDQSDQMQDNSYRDTRTETNFRRSQTK